jgi:hypothetical protein
MQSVNLMAFLPLLLIGTIFAVVIFLIACRKRCSRAWGLMGYVPLSNFITLIYVASLPDRGLLDRLEKLEQAVDGTFGR